MSESSNLEIEAMATYVVKDCCDRSVSPSWKHGIVDIVCDGLDTLSPTPMDLPPFLLMDLNASVKSWFFC